MNTETSPIKTVMEAKTAVHSAMHTMGEHMKWIEKELRYMPTVQGCNNAWLEVLNIQKECENLKNMIDQLGAIVDTGRN
jgi:hypothetical protein